MRNCYYSEEADLRVTSEQGKVNEMNAKLLFTVYWALIKAFQECQEMYMRGEITLGELKAGHAF